MILAPNHQQLLSGNKRLLIALGLALLVSACSPKVSVLKSPDHRGGNVGSNNTGVDKNSSSKNEAEIEEAKRRSVIANNIALVLPFQLDRLNPAALSKEDVKRSSIALDFYQGFQFGLDELAKEGKSFGLNVIDSKDNENQSISIAKSEDIEGASLIVGPVYPKEIRAFGTNLPNNDVLQINPLAASKASDFNLSNLVSLTPSIDVHTQAIARRVAKDYSIGDVVIVYNTSDNDGKQFLSNFIAQVKIAKSSILIKSVTSLEQLNESLTTGGTNILVVGSTDKYQLRTLLSNLDRKSTEGFYSFNLYGHPLWDRIDFSIYDNFSNYNPVITSESHLKTWTTTVKQFKDAYYTLYGVNPSDYSYKGYDAARYFGGLLSKYGNSYAKHILTENFDGIFSSYSFDQDPNSGYVNKNVSYKIYKGTSFQLN
ncbi:ABC transporter substrate-binding protein [Sphingobacterium sp. LRF_L2]|uniref:ABC transporter substrate-binding protein n=1 Tax=Sphingobacterium sp. LRF_L2 TaxID=3369421 RepID=UPI003F5FC550